MYRWYLKQLHQSTWSIPYLILDYDDSQPLIRVTNPSFRFNQTFSGIIMMTIQQINRLLSKTFRWHGGFIASLWVFTILNMDYLLLLSHTTNAASFGEVIITIYYYWPMYSRFSPHIRWIRKCISSPAKNSSTKPKSIMTTGSGGGIEHFTWPQLSNSILLLLFSKINHMFPVQDRKCTVNERTFHSPTNDHKNFSKIYRKMTGRNPHTNAVLSFLNI